MENATDLTIDSSTFSQRIPTRNTTESSPITGVDSKMATKAVYVEANPNETTSPASSSIESKTDSIKTASLDADKNTAVPAASNLKSKIASVDLNETANQATVEPGTRSDALTDSKTESRNSTVDMDDGTIAISGPNSKVNRSIEVANTAITVVVDSDNPTESTTELKTVPDVTPPISHETVDTKPTTDIYEAAVVQIKMNTVSGPSIVQKAMAESLPSNISSPKSSKSDTITNHKKPITPRTISKTQSKAYLAASNKENVKPVPTGPTNFNTGAVVELKKSPIMNSARSNNNNAEMKRLSELRAKCRARGIDSSGSLADLAEKLSKDDQREREFEQEFERQQQEFQRKKAEEEKVKAEDSVNSGKTEDQSFPQPSPQAFSNAPEVHPSIEKPRFNTSESNANSAHRQSGSSCTKIRSPTIPYTTAPFARPFISQDVRQQRDGMHINTTTTRTNRSFISQDIRLQPDLVIAKMDLAAPPGPQIVGSHRVTMPSNSGTLKPSKIFPSQDIRAQQDVLPASFHFTKITRPTAQDSTIYQAGKRANVELAETSREADKVNYLHTHTSQIKDECTQKGLSRWGDRKTVVARLLDHYLSSLWADFRLIRDKIDRDPKADPEGLLKKDILWYRLECFLEHRQNQVGLASEPNRTASYIAAKECKYASPRFAKIMGDKLVELIAQEKQLEEQKATRELELNAASKQADIVVKLEPEW